MIKHIGIIMDGNRRWAEEKKLPKIMGHKFWADNVVKITEYADKLWIKNLTLWALSADNLQKREKKEVEAIIKLVNNIEKYLWKMKVDNLRFETIWDLTKLPEESQKNLTKVKNDTKNNTGIILTLALVYWGQDEIIRATKKILKDWLDPEKLTKENFREYLDTHFLPPIDLIIRTGWDMRHSGFMLYDSEYSEYYFTPKKWPEFDKKEFDKALDSFSWTKRNFGK